MSPASRARLSLHCARPRIRGPKERRIAPDQRGLRQTPLTRNGACLSMRIGVQNSFPNHPHSAEAGWIRRCFTACNRLGFEPVEVITSDDIIRCQPDCVLVTHEVSPKLTPFPTLGLMWSPPAFYAEDPMRRKSILSLDGHLCGSRQIAQWIDDFTTGHGKRAVIHDGLMLPSTPDLGSAGLLPPKLSIMYAGVRWDGSRHGEIFRGLDGRVPLRLYGPPQAGAACGTRHRGIPLFEAAAGGALIITDDFDFPREWFRDSVLYVDAELPAPMVIEQIQSHVEWAERNPEAANRLAQRSNELFRRRLTLESMLRPLPHFVDRVRECRSMVVVQGSTEKPQPTVEYIVGIGSRPVKTLGRALDSLAAQTYEAIAVTLVQFHPIAG